MRIGVLVEKEKTMPVIFGTMKKTKGFRIDLLVENKVVVEIKAVERLMPIHHQQLLTYLRLGNFKTGLLINFNVQHLRDGLKRVSN